MLRAFKRAQAGVSLPVLEAALASADQGKLAQLGDISAALLEKELSGPAPALNAARANNRLRLLVYTSPSLAVSLEATQAAAGAGAAAALCKTGVGMAKPIPAGPKGVIIEEVIALRQQGYTFAQIRDKFGWKSTFKPHAIIKKYAPQLAGKSKTPIPSVPGTLPRPAPRAVPKPAGRSIRVPMSESDFRDLAHSEFNLLSEPSWKAMENYKGSGYSSINDYLRNPASVVGRYPRDYRVEGIKRLKSSITHLDTAFLSLENELTVYRGGWRGQVKVGDVFADKAFVSTSLSRNTAEGFTTVHSGVKTIWKIRVPSGAQVSLPCCGNMQELEVLLARGSKLRVTEVIDKAWTGRSGRGFTRRTVLAVLVI